MLNIHCFHAKRFQRAIRGDEEAIEEKKEAIREDKGGMKIIASSTAKKSKKSTPRAL